MKDCQISSKAGQFLPGQISEIQISSLGFGKNWVLVALGSGIVFFGSY
jgi:hypothetical protein